MKVIILLILWGMMVRPVMGAMVAPTEESNRYRMKSTDGKIEVIFDKKYGGAITGVYDYEHTGDKNLVDDSQAGAMFQAAFWVLPYHSTLDATKALPPGCGPTGDMLLDNPTQAGFVGWGHAGNPIGYWGTSSIQDTNEFIVRENNDRTFHFKSKFIRYDYCFSGAALPSEGDCDAAAKTSYLNNPNATCKDLWDTDFYIEQWASFREDLPHTLVLRSKIIYVGTGEKSITSRSLPIIFTQNLDKMIYWENGKKVNGPLNAGFLNFNPDKSWAAQINTAADSGISMVMQREFNVLFGRKKFGGEAGGSDNVGHFFAGEGTVDFSSIGTLSGVTLESVGNPHIYNFSQNGYLEWTTYYPIGSSDYLKKTSESIISYPTGKALTEKIDGWAEAITCTKTSGWASNAVTKTGVDKIRAEIYPINEYDNKVEKSTTTFFNRDGLGAYCGTTACGFNLDFGSLPTSFAGKKLLIDVWGETSNGGYLLSWNNGLVGPCTNIGTPPTQIPPTQIPPTQIPPTQIPPTQIPPTQIPPTEVPPTEVPAVPADYDGNRVVDKNDFETWKAEFLLGKSTKDKFEIWKAEYLKK